MNKINEAKAAGLTAVLKIAHWVVVFNTGGAEQWIALILAEGYNRLPAISRSKSKMGEHQQA